MRFRNGLDEKKLRSQLSLMLDQEKKSIGGRIQQLRLNEKRCEEWVEIRQRDAVVRWLLSVHYKLGYSPDTFELSVSILDRFLLLVRAQPKYLRCIAISSYFLAAKCMEEDEVILATCDLVAISNCGCSVAEVLRMERVILSKLKWDPQSKTVLDFVNVLYALLMFNQDNLINQDDADYQLMNLIRKLYTCLCKYEVRSFPPSTLAVALISVELSCHTRNWLAITILLQKEVSLDNLELIRCREVISRILSRNQSINRGHSQSYKGEVKPCKRKVEQTEVDDDVYEGIKRLYGDEANIYDSILSCSSQAAFTAAAMVNSSMAAVAAL